MILKQCNLHLTYPLSLRLCKKYDDFCAYDEDVLLDEHTERSARIFGAKEGRQQTDASTTCTYDTDTPLYQSVDGHGIACHLSFKKHEVEIKRSPGTPHEGCFQFTTA
jgi:hypothetical protein